MPIIIGFATSIASFLVRYFSFRTVKITLSLFFGSIAVAFILTFFYFGLEILLQIWSFIKYYTDQANQIGNISSWSGVAVAFLDASGLLSALSNVFDLSFTILFLIFAKATYQYGKFAIVFIHNTVQSILSNL